MTINDILKTRKGWKRFIVDGKQFNEKEINKVLHLQVASQKIDYAEHIIHITTK